ncbi:MAG: coatomer subunit beta [Watsoniomyces obsoletus]|nr:MAG: coatomer subunit beta [Watsoniomyces obsoletus]
MASNDEWRRLECHNGVVMSLEKDGLTITGLKPGMIEYPTSGISCLPPFQMPGITAGQPKTLKIPYYNILGHHLEGDRRIIQHVIPKGKKVVRPASLIIQPQTKLELWWQALDDRAYGPGREARRIKVLVNPFGGRGKAQRFYRKEIEPILAMSPCRFDMEETQYQGHAVEIASKLDITQYDVVACCSGDGLPHEVFNGLGKRPDAMEALRRICVVQLPCGTGNAMSWNLFGTGSPSLATLAMIKSYRTPLDLMSITQGGRRTLSFLSQSLGIIAECDLATEHLRWIGDVRTTYGVLVRLITKKVYPCDIAVGVEIDEKPQIRAHYERELLRKFEPMEEEEEEGEKDVSSGNNHQRDAPGTDNTNPKHGHGQQLPPLRFGTSTDPLPAEWDPVPYEILTSFYAGNMAYMAEDRNFFPAALPHDGYMDLSCVGGEISRLECLKTLMAVENNQVFDVEQVSYRKVVGYRISPRQVSGGGGGRGGGEAKEMEMEKGMAKGKGKWGDGYISIDGERIPFEPFQAEVHRGLGRVLTKGGKMFEAPGVVPRGSMS